VKSGDPVGSPINTVPWKVGTWVWHVHTKKGPYVVVEDDPRRDLVYVDTKPINPASAPDLRQHGYDRKKIDLGHRHVAHFYRSMLTDQKPDPGPHWTTRVDWKLVGEGAGFVTGIFAVLIFCLLVGWIVL
jgi:hypothetical protein